MRFKKQRICGRRRQFRICSMMYTVSVTVTVKVTVTVTVSLSLVLVACARTQSTGAVEITKNMNDPFFMFKVM